MEHLTELSIRESSSIRNNIDEMVNYFSFTLQQAAYSNKAYNPKFSQKRRKRKKTKV